MSVPTVVLALSVADVSRSPGQVPKSGKRHHFRHRRTGCDTSQPESSGIELSRGLGRHKNIAGDALTITEYGIFFSLLCACQFGQFRYSSECVLSL